MGSRVPPLYFLFFFFFFFFFFFLLQAYSVFSQNIACNSNDLTSLQGFMEGLNSSIPSWNLITSDCCNWTGVYCDNGGRVIGLNLFNMSLRGSISNSFGGLDQLQRINLSSNSLDGPVPKQLFHLPLLEQLDLSMNELSGQIPLDSDLPLLQLFNVSSNLFNGSHPLLVGSKKLTSFDIGSNMFSGNIDTSICIDWTSIRVLRFSMNSFSGDFPTGFGNCSLLSELALDMNAISGNLPEDLFKLASLTKLFVQRNRLSGNLNAEISNLSNLVQLDVSLNSFSGFIPNVFNRFKKLEYLSAESNSFHGYLPSTLSNLPTLQVLNLRNNSLSGRISLNFTAMAKLCYLDLGSNLFNGLIPSELSQCLELTSLNLANNRLTGEIPNSFKNLVSLSHLSLSKNSLSNISSALGILQQCPNLTNLVLTKNFLSGEMMPIDGIQGFPNLELLVIPNCGLLGSVPYWLVKSTKLKVLDLSWNRLEGKIPSWMGKLEHLFYLDLSNNSFTGEMPNSLTQMKGFMYFNNSSQGPSIQEFPFFMKRNNSTGKGLQYKEVKSFPPSLILSDNMLVGPILRGFGDLQMLLVLDLSKNRLSGSIPNELSNMSSLETLDLSHNNLSGSIPFSLTKLNFLSSFDVSYNNLVGLIPSERQFSTFSSADFEGNPSLCDPRSSSSPCTSNDPIYVRRQRKNIAVISGMAIGIGLGMVLLLSIVYLIVSRRNSRIQEESANGHLESSGSRVVLLSQMKDNKEISIHDILKSTDNFCQANIIGCGGFGLVYKAALPDGRKVAIKRLSGDYGQMEREFLAEVEALSKAQHQNLVLLQGYCEIENDKLLIYSYMENGSLDYWLHEKTEEGMALDWETRLRIARGSARGLAYLHQSCQPHVLHRDIKSSNILLDENFEAHLADFGLARLLLPCDTHVTTDLVGTLGYIPPEYSQSPVATFKGDVYSFGVVLLELLTGRRPVDMSMPKESRNLFYWVVQMKNEKRESEVFDPFIYDKDNHSQMAKMLDIAFLCLSSSPKMRPSTDQIVTWLDSIGIDDRLIK